MTTFILHLLEERTLYKKAAAGCRQWMERQDKDAHQPEVLLADVSVSNHCNLLLPKINLAGCNLLSRRFISG
jgi:hypothetical protein